MSPPLELPVGVQTLRVTLRSPSAQALVQVRARPLDGGPEVDLGVLEPGRRRASLPVGVAHLAGRGVRVVIDPVPGLGTAVELLRVGPVTAPLPRWRVDRGTLEVTGARGRRTVRVTDAPLVLRSPAHRPPRTARALWVDVRGEGTLRASAGGRAVRARATSRWRRMSVPLRPRRAGRVVLRLVAAPGPGGLELRRLGAALRSPGPWGGSGSR